MSKIADVFDKVCQENAKRDAIYFYDKGLKKRTYGELKSDIDSCINYFLHANIKKGERVFIFAPVSYNLTVFMIAAFKLGVQVMFLDINARQETFDELFRHFRPKYVLVSNKTRYLYFMFSKIRRGFEILNVDKMISSRTLVEDLPKIPNDTPALLTTTTGSTGVPKIVVRSHLDLYNQLELIDKNLPKERHKFMMSTSFIYVFAILARGDTVVLSQLNLRAPAKLINRRLRFFEHLPISIIITSPVFGLKAKNVFPKLEQLYVGGASINLREAEKIQNEFSSSENYIVYGATECNIMARVLLPDYINELRNNYRSMLGRPFDGVRIKISNDDSIMVSCSALIKGFVNEESKYVICKDDWYNTNDKGFIEKGVLYYRGKYNYYIVFKGKKIYSHEIEQFLSVKFPDYKECAVVQKRGTIYLFGTERGRASELSVALYEEYGFRVRFKYIRKLPYDIRHHTKIDHKKLLSLI